MSDVERSLLRRKSRCSIASGDRSMSIALVADWKRGDVMAYAQVPRMRAVRRMYGVTSEKI